MKKLLSKFAYWIKVLFGLKAHKESDTEYNDRAW